MEKTCVFCEETILANAIFKHIASKHLNVVLKNLIERFKEEGHEALVEEQLHAIESKVKSLQLKETEKVVEVLKSSLQTEQRPMISCELCGKLVFKSV